MKHTESDFSKDKGSHNLLSLPITRWALSIIIALSFIPAGGPLSFPSNAYGDHFDPDEVDGSELKWSMEDGDEEQYDPVADLAYYYNLTQYSYILYYGQFDKSVTSAILSAKPTLLITNYYAMDHQTREQFAENNVTVIAYVPVTWTQRDIGSTLDEILNLLDDGADGIFVDEAATMSNDWEVWYHGQIYNAVKDHDEENIVVINPGTASIDEKSMLVADIICFEHDWRNFEDIEWALDYPGWRFMGISSNEFHKVMGYNVDKESALDDLEEARHMNIAYQYSADHYIWLPPWLDVYGGIAGLPHPVSDYSLLDLAPVEQARSEPQYPISVTETGQAGNESDSDMIEEQQDDEATNDSDTVNDDPAEDGSEETREEEEENNDQDSDVTTDSPKEDDDKTNNQKDNDTNSTEQDDSSSDATDTLYNTTMNESYDLNANVTSMEPAVEEENSANATASE